jgi:hypothetical protein
MKTIKKLILFIILVFPTASWAEEEESQFLSGKIGMESGVFQPPQDSAYPYVYSRLVLESHPGMTEGLSLGLEVQANAQASGTNMPPSEPEAPSKNIVSLQWETMDAEDSLESGQMEVDQLNLHWATGPLDLKLGLFKPDWGSSFFYRPTDYFFPIQPLVWLKGEPSGSEGADAACFLFDDLNLEGAVRWLEGGTAEGVFRLTQKGIGLTITPSIAWMDKQNELGLEIMGTFPTFQIRFEGVDRLYPDGHTAQDWNFGVSTLRYGVKYTAEVLRDGTGEILADDLNDTPGTYLFISAEGTLTPEWKISPAVVGSLEGGPILFWPKINWAFAASWEVGIQAQLPLGEGVGPLEKVPGRAGLSLAYIL